MSILSGLVDFLTVKRSELVGDDQGTTSVLFDAEEQAPGDDGETFAEESEPAEWWQHYGFASRPPKNAQAATMRVGASFIAFASKMLAAAKIYGKLAEGDVALYSTGNNSIRLNNSGSVSIVCEDGSKQIVFTISPKTHSIQAVTAGGLAFEMSDERGITLNAGTKMLTLASAQGVQIIGPSAVIQTGTVKLGMQASKPLVGVAALIPGAPNVFI